MTPEQAGALLDAINRQTEALRLLTEAVDRLSVQVALVTMFDDEEG